MTPSVFKKNDVYCQYHHIIWFVYPSESPDWNSLCHTFSVMFEIIDCVMMSAACQVKKLELVTQETLVQILSRHTHVTYQNWLNRSPDTSLAKAQLPFMSENKIKSVNSFTFIVTHTSQILFKNTNPDWCFADISLLLNIHYRNIITTKLDFMIFIKTSTTQLLMFGNKTCI